MALKERKEKKTKQTKLSPLVCGPRRPNRLPYFPPPSRPRTARAAHFLPSPLFSLATRPRRSVSSTPPLPLLWLTVWAHSTASSSSLLSSTTMDRGRAGQRQRPNPGFLGFPAQACRAEPYKARALSLDSLFQSMHLWNHPSTTHHRFYGSRCVRSKTPPRRAFPVLSRTEPSTWTSSG